MKTRTQNATTHPGNIVLESGRSRRSQEEVEEEKKQKKARKNKEERRKIEAEAWKKAGNDYIAQLDAVEAAAAANAEKDFPRHRSTTQGTVPSPFIPNEHFLMFSRQIKGESFP